VKMCQNFRIRTCTWGDLMGPQSDEDDSYSQVQSFPPNSLLLELLTRSTQKYSHTSTRTTLDYNLMNNLVNLQKLLVIIKILKVIPDICHVITKAGTNVRNPLEILENLSVLDRCVSRRLESSRRTKNKVIRNVFYGEITIQKEAGGDWRMTELIS